MWVLLHWAAASVPTTEPGWVSYLGPFIPFAILAMWGLLLLWRRLAEQDKQHREDMAEAARQHRDDMAEKDRLLREMSDRAVEQAERQAPLLTAATNALSEAARELSRRPP